MTPTNEVDLILQKANIADVIGRYIEVQKKGNSYVAVCPFHDDGSPSLNISVEKRIFKCFPCGVGGNAITFVQKFKSLSFPEALAEVGKTVGVDIRVGHRSREKYSSIQERVIAINEEAMNYFSTMLFTKEGKSARNYLDGRKILLKDIRTHNIGYAKIKYDLYDYLHNKKKFSVKEIEESALFRKKGLTYLPIFFNRLIFPIRDFEGKVIGFSGRVIEKVEGAPKYLNTSENVVFKKSHLAYNFSNAESAIRVKDEIIILEGYMDVISLNRADVKNVVAIMGTSLSEFQVKEFKKLTSNFTIFLDGDAPGINATLKLIKQLSNYEVNIKVVFNQTGMDPDELIQAGDKNKVVDMLTRTKSAIEFAIEIARNKIEKNNSIESKEEATKIFFEVLQFEKNKMWIDTSLSAYATILGADKNSVESEFENFKSNHPQLHEKKVEIKKEIRNEIQQPHFDHQLEEALSLEMANEMQNQVSDFYENTFEEKIIIEPQQIPNEVSRSTENQIVYPIPTQTDERAIYFNALWILLEAIFQNTEVVLKNENFRAMISEEDQSLFDTLFEIKKQNPEMGKVEILNLLQEKKYILQKREYDRIFKLATTFMTNNKTASIENMAISALEKIQWIYYRRQDELLKGPQINSSRKYDKLLMSEPDKNDPAYPEWKKKFIEEEERIKNITTKNNNIKRREKK